MKQACSQCGAEISLPGQAVVEGYVCPGCRGSLPRRFGKYAVTGFIGAGGMGQVFKATHPELLRTVAIKVLPEQEDPDLVRRFLREAQVAAKLDHPGIVRVHDTGQDGDRHFIVMEYVEGVSLHERIGKLDVASAIRIVAEVARALDYAHEQGVVHRDIKPSNIILDPKGRPRLLDFGLAKGTEDATLTSTGQIVGTPHYMAPEQAAAGATDRRTDVYALGAVLYELATGTAPLKADTVLALLRKIDTEMPRPPSEVRPGLPSGLDAVCLRALAKKPEDRFPTAAGFADAVEALSAGAAPARRRARWPIALLAILPILGIAVVFWPRGRPPRPEPQPQAGPQPFTPAKEEPSTPPAVTASSSARSLLRLAVPGVYGFDADFTGDHPLVVALRLTQQGEYERAERALQGATGRDAYYVRGVIALERSIHLGDAPAFERWLKEFPAVPEPRLRVLRAVGLGKDDPELPAGTPETAVVRMILAARAGRFDDAGPDLWPALQFLRLFASQRIPDDEVRAGLTRPAAPALLRAVFHALMSDWSKAEAALGEGQDYSRLRGSDLLRDFAVRGRSSRANLTRYGALLQFQCGDPARGVRTAQGLLGSGTDSREIRADLNYLLATHFGRRGDESRFFTHLEGAVKNGAPVGRAKEDFPKWKDDPRFRAIVGE